jgi:hypothetical protein
MKAPRKEIPMKKTIAMLGILTLGLALSMSAGCSRDEAKETAAKAKDAAAEATAAAGAAAGEATAAAGAAAGEAAAKVEQKVDDAAARMEAAADPVARCRELAAKGAWADALEPCAKAHEMKPDDMALEHAFQQAQAAVTQ